MCSYSLLPSEASLNLHQAQDGEKVRHQRSLEHILAFCSSYLSNRVYRPRHRIEHETRVGSVRARLGS